MKYENLILLDILHTEEISTLGEKVFLVDEVFALLQCAYAQVEGGLHFKDPDELLCKTSVWKVIYHDSDIVGVVIYKSKRGLKMVALALAELEKSLKRYTQMMLAYLFKMTFTHTWMEVSEAAERFIVKNGGSRYFVPNVLASKLTEKKILELCDDGYHYKRSINGIVKTKVIVGHPRFSEKEIF